jgi:membrane protein DedA with SNARE-associated domain
VIEFSSYITSLLLIIEQLGYVGIFIGMTIESSFFPFPSEIILIPAGALIAKGEMALFPVFFASLIGSLLGALINFYLAFFLGRKTIELLVDKYGRFLFINNKKLIKTDNYFENYGEITTFIGRLIPIVRQLISIPAGFSKMNISKFCLFTLLGSGIWTLFLIYTGYFFGSEISSMRKIIITSVILIISLIILIIYILKRKRTIKKSST